MKKSYVIVAAIALTAFMLLVPAYSSLSSDASNTDEKTTSDPDITSMLGIDQNDVQTLGTIITLGSFYEFTDEDNQIITEPITVADGDTEMLAEQVTFESEGKYIVESGGTLGIGLNVTLQASGEIFEFQEGSSLCIYANSDYGYIYLYTYTFEEDVSISLDGIFTSDITYDITIGDSTEEITADAKISIADGTSIAINDVIVTSNGISSINATLDLTISTDAIVYATSENYSSTTKPVASDSFKFDFEVTTDIDMTVTIDEVEIEYTETDSYAISFDPSATDKNLNIEGTSDISIKSGTEISMTCKTTVSLYVTLSDTVSYLKSMDTLSSIPDITPYINGTVTVEATANMDIQMDEGSIVIDDMTVNSETTFDTDNGCTSTSTINCKSISISDDEDSVLISGMTITGEMSVNADWVPEMIDVVVEYYETQEFDEETFLSAVEKIIADAEMTITVDSIAVNTEAEYDSMSLHISDLKITGNISFEELKLTIAGSISIGNIDYVETDTNEYIYAAVDEDTYELEMTVDDLVLEGNITIDFNAIESSEYDLVTFDAELSVGSLTLSDDSETITISDASIAITGTMNLDTETEEPIADMTLEASMGGLTRTVTEGNETSVLTAKNLDVTLVFNDVDLASLLDGDLDVLLESLDISESSATLEQITYSVHGVTLTIDDVSLILSDNGITVSAKTLTLNGTPNVTAAKNLSVNLSNIEITMDDLSFENIEMTLNGSATINYMDGSSMSITANNAVIGPMTYGYTTYTEIRSGSVTITTSGGAVDIGQDIAVADGATLTINGDDLQIGSLFLEDGANFTGTVNVDYSFVDVENGYDLAFNITYNSGCLPQVTSNTSGITVKLYPNTGYSAIKPWTSGVTYTVDTSGVATLIEKSGSVEATAEAIDYELMIDGTQQGIYNYDEPVSIAVPVKTGYVFVCYKDNEGEMVGNITEGYVYFTMPAEDYSLTTVWGLLAEASGTQTVNVNSESMAFENPSAEGTYMFKLSNGVIVKFDSSNMSADEIRFTAEKWNGEWSVSNSQVYSMDLQGAKGVTIYIPVSNDNQTVYHVDEYGRFVEISGVIVTMDGAKYVSFDADSFSFYFVEGSNSSSSNNMILIVAAVIIVVIAILLVAYYFMHKKKTST